MPGLSCLPPVPPLGLAILTGLSGLVASLIGRPEDAITAAITTTVVLIVAEVSPHDAWAQPILRLADTVIGVAVGLAAAWLVRRAAGFLRGHSHRSGGPGR